MSDSPKRRADSIGPLRQPVPLLDRADALVVEGTLAGCVAAYTLARAGRRTVLASSACSLPFEAVVCRRPWAAEKDLARLPAPFRTAFQQSVAQKSGGGEVILNLAQLAVKVEDLLLDAGVALHYGMKPCGVIRGRSRAVSGVVFGGKFGLQAVAAGAVVDCAAHAVIPTLADGPVRLRPAPGGKALVWFSAKVGVADGNAPITQDRCQRNTCPTVCPEEKMLRVPNAKALAGGRIRLHGPYAEFALRLPVGADDALWLSRLSNAAREALIEIGARLAQQRKAEGKRPLFFHRFPGGMLTGPLFRICAASPADPFRPEGLENVWVCGPAADVGDKRADRLADPYRSARVAAAMARKIAASRRPCSAGSPSRAPLAADGLRFQDGPLLHDSGERVAWDISSLPLLAECDVLVAGGGTSGVPAALAAAESGAQTILVEQMADVGGVRTTGGVGSYWFGRETPYQRACDDAYDRISERSGVAEEAAMLRHLLDAGVRVMANCPVVGVVREGYRVAGIVAATARGPGVIRARTTVDATGDADLAAWAGAPFEYGNGRDAWTLWGSFANFNAEKRTASRQYESAIEVRDARDFARTIITSRRRQGMWKTYAHEMPQHYVAPRETRRIIGDATVTYAGILAGETFPDVMAVCEANFDIKGIATSDLDCCGVISGWDVRMLYRAAVPWRAVLPQDVEDLIVAGRAYSASHDALSLARMQRDMVSLGAAAGVAAARAARQEVRPRGLDVPALQEEWVRQGILRAADLRRYGKPMRPYRRQDAERDIRGFIAGRGRWQCRLARLTGSPVSLGPLRRVFAAEKNKTRKVKLARALCFLGDARGVPFLLDVVAEQVWNGLPRPLRKTLAVPPEHGWAAEPVYSLYAIGLAGRGKDAARLLERIATAVEDNPDRFALKHDSQFEYVRVICSVAERNPGPAMLPALEALRRKKCLRGLAIPWEADPRRAVDSVLERRAYLEHSLGRALARCGDRRGYDILRRYADDIRGPLARSAADELRNLASTPRRRGRLPVTPFTRRIE